MAGEGTPYQQCMPDNRPMYPQSPMSDERHVYTQSPVTYGGTTNFTAVNVMSPGMMVPLEGQPMWPPSNVFSPVIPVTEGRMGQQMFYPPGDRELKNAHVRNGQPTPPPFDDKRGPQQMTATTTTGLYRVASASFQFNPAPPPETMYYSPPDSLNGAASVSSPSPTGGRRHKIEESDDGDVNEEKAKRRRFLERNRVAASKCRQKKKTEVENLRQTCERLETENKVLGHEATKLQNQILDLKNLALGHSHCGYAPIDQYLEKMLSTISAAKETNEGREKKEDTPSVPVDVPTAAPAVPSQSLSFGFDGTEASAPASDTIEPSPADLVPTSGGDSDSSYLNDPSFMFDPDDNPFDDFINQDG